MQDVSGGRRRIGVKVIPALAGWRGSRVPCDAERLQASAGNGDQILLKRIDAERVSDVEVADYAVGSFRADDVSSVALREGRRDAVQRKRLTGKRRLHAKGRRRAHSVRVHGAAPARGLDTMAGRTRVSADVAGANVWRRGCGLEMSRPRDDQRDGCDQGGDGCDRAG